MGEGSFASIGEVPAKVIIDDPDVQVLHLTPEPGESYTWIAGEHPTVITDLDLNTPDVTYLEPGESYDLPAKDTQTNGFNLVELRYYA